MQRRVELVGGTCRCGRKLLIEQHPDGRGFTSHHEAPLCAEYEAVLASMPAAVSVATSRIDFPPAD